jgi:hypothetical protein
MWYKIVLFDRNKTILHCKGDCPERRGRGNAAKAAAMQA